MSVMEVLPGDADEERVRLVSAYLFRCDGVSWEQIARWHGFPSQVAARVAVKRLALRFKMPWPIKP